jgi:multidrug resistance efflux pump
MFMKYSKAERRTRVIWPVLGAIIVLAAVAAGALSVLWSEHWKPQPKAPAAQPAARPFVAGEISLSGKIQAQHAVLVPAPVEGKVDVFHVEIGQDVYEGQLLAQIKSDSLDTASQQATELAEGARNKVNDLEATLISARLEASRARALASRLRSEFDRSEKTYQRQRMLLSAGATPRMVFEKAEKQYQTDQAESAGAETLAEQAESRVSTLMRDYDAAKKSFEEKAQELEQAKADLEAAQVHSPVDGIVAGRRGNAGDDVDRTMKDLFQIATDPSQLAVVVEPEPPVLARIRPGQAAVVTVTEAQNEPLAAEVRKVENGQVTIEFISPDPAVRPGLTAQVRIKLT